MTGELRRRLHLALERRFPEQRLFLKTDSATRFLRIGPVAQVSILIGGTLLLAWTVMVSSVFLVNSLAKDSGADQLLRQRVLYESRLAEMERERDMRMREARTAQERFQLALQQVSAQQTALLQSEDRRRELEQAGETLQRLLREALRERDRARQDVASLRAELLAETGSGVSIHGRTRELEDTLDYMVVALGMASELRDAVRDELAERDRQIAELELDIRLGEERTERIFTRLEEAATVSLEPLERMFERAGLNTQNILREVRRGFGGTGGPLTPLSFSTRGEPEDELTRRANDLIMELDRINLYRIAVQSAPFGYPVRSAHRFTSGFGYRTDPKTGGRRLHAGIDLAAPRGTPIYATADGVVVQAGWQGGYGRMVTIRHSFGLETRYAHLHQIRVRQGQRVSRGDRIGDMGTTGRSTGVHLHYEVLSGGRPVNPMTFIRAARDVF